MTKEEQLVELLRMAENMAVKYADGHVTIMRFTTGWKVMLGTPEMTVEFSGEDFEITGGGYGEVGRLPGFDSLEEAVTTLIKELPCRRYSQTLILPSDFLSHDKGKYFL
jgi:hypothetical protein